MRNLYFCYQNVRGLRTKLNTFSNNVLQCKYDVIALTETFLNSSVLDGELFTSEYVVVRNDRTGDVGWGGVLLAVRNCYTVQRVTNVDAYTPDMELLFAIIGGKSVEKFLCCVVYLPPNCSDNLYLDVLTCIENAIISYSSLNVVIIGDFNLNSCSVNVKFNFNSFCDYSGLQQHNIVYNKCDGMLDLVLSNFNPEQVLVSEGSEPLVPIDKYHPALEVTLRFQCDAVARSPSSPPRTRRPGAFPNWDWHKADFLGLYTALKSLDWSDMLSMAEVDDAVELFYHRIYNCISQYVPIKSRYMPNYKYVYPKWFNADIIRNIREKYYHLKRYKAEGKDYNKELFKFYRWHVKNLIDNAYKQHLHMTEKNIVNDPAKFWEYVKDRKKDRLRTNVYSSGGVEVVGQAAADAFADYFSSVYQDAIPVLDHVDAARAADSQKDSTCITIKTVDENKLNEAVRRLKPRSSCGPDGIPVFLAKDCISAFKIPLLYLFNLSLTHSKYPEIWKVSRVTPVPKTDGANDVTSFRPIAVLSVFAKLFEIVLCQQINKQTQNLLHDSQHGFRTGRSTTSNLVAHLDYTYAELDAGRQVDVAYFDFKKAFDMVDNDILLRKLAVIGFAPELVELFSNYLRDRRQFVRVDAFESSDYFTRSGVSQGSTLGPLLFLIFINDLPNSVIASKCLLFADDLKLSLGVDDPSDCEALQRDIDAVMDWSKLNRLPFNNNKCKIITFTRKRSPLNEDYELSDAPLERVSEIRDLGLLLDSKLDFHNHVTTVCKKASKMLGFVIRTSSQFDGLGVALVLYNAFVRSKLEYGAIVWNPHEEKYTLMIEKIQRKFARWLYKKKYGYYPYLYPSLYVSGMVGLDTLKLRRAMQLITYYLAIIRNRIESSTILGRVGLLAPGRLGWDMEGTVAPRRRPRLLWRPPARTRCGAHAPTTRAIRLIGDMLADDYETDLFADSFGQLCNKSLLFLTSIFDIL